MLGFSMRYNGATLGSYGKPCLQHERQRDRDTLFLQQLF